MSDNKQRGDEALEKLEKAVKSRDRKQKMAPATIVAIALVVIVGVVGGIWFATSRDDEASNQAAEETTTTDTQYKPLALKREMPLDEKVMCTYPADGRDANGATVPPTADVPARGNVTVKLDTTQGEIGLKLDREAAPCTVNAIEHLAKEGYFDNSVCHRITTSGIHVLQCGDPTGTGTGGPGFQFANEYPTDEATDTNTPVVYPRGSIAMANAGKDTNGSQFFLNYQDSPLPPLYTYFGEVDANGLKTLDKIAEKGAQGGASDGAPAEEVKINKATVS